MSLENDVKTITEYNEWSARMKTMAADVSPERFVIEKAREEAFERVEAAIKYLESYSDTWSEPDFELHKMLTGEDE